MIYKEHRRLTKAFLNGRWLSEIWLGGRLIWSSIYVYARAVAVIRLDGTCVLTTAEGVALVIASELNISFEAAFKIAEGQRMQSRGKLDLQGEASMITWDAVDPVGIGSLTVVAVDNMLIVDGTNLDSPGMLIFRGTAAANSAVGHNSEAPGEIYSRCTSTGQMGDGKNFISSVLSVIRASAFGIPADTTHLEGVGKTILESIAEILSAESKNLVESGKLTLSGESAGVSTVGENLGGDDKAQILSSVADISTKYPRFTQVGDTVFVFRPKRWKQEGDVVYLDYEVVAWEYPEEDGDYLKITQVYSATESGDYLEVT